jgi:hypothetical protein
MQTKNIKASFEKEGKRAERTGTVSVAENVQDLLAMFKGVVEELVKYVNDAFETDETSKLYQAARLEIVGVDDKIERLAKRLQNDRKNLGRPEWPWEKALAVAKEQLAD